MEPLTLSDILDLDRYEQVRDDYRARVIAHKADRRVGVGPQISLVFEDRETLRYQIQEMARIERTTQPDKVQLEVDVYNELMPGLSELSATLFIEIPDLDEIRPALDRLVGIDEHVSILVGPEESEMAEIRARFDERQMEDERISAVHYLRFTLTPQQAEAFRSGPLPRLRIDHPSYTHEARLTEQTRNSLAADLQGAAPVLLDTDSLRAKRPPPPTVLRETARVRVLRLAPDPAQSGARERIAVVPTDDSTSFEDAGPDLLAELLAAAQEAARQLRGRTGEARVRFDVPSGKAGSLRIEITAGA